MEQVREEQVVRTVCTRVPTHYAAARGSRGRTGSGVGQPRRATGFWPDSGRCGQDMGHQAERENSDWSAETIRQSQEATSGNKEMGLERLRRKEELEKQRLEELAKQEREELEKKEREPEDRQREEELERQRREAQTESNNLLEQEIREWEREQQERAAELEKQKRVEQLEIQKREAELERRKQEVEQKSLTIEKEELMFKKDVDSEQELRRQARERELIRQKREKALEAELEQEKQGEAEKLERKRKEEEKLERQRREKEAEQEKQRREEEIKRKRREWEFKKREYEEKLEREKQQWSQAKQKQEEELRKQEMEEALNSKKAEELRKQNIFLVQLRMEREKELQRVKQMERDLNAIEHINVAVKKFKGDVIGKTKTLPDLVRALYEVADAVDEDHRAATLAGCAGAGLSVAGGVVAISGAVLAPFTGGASLVATVGVGGSFLGSVTRIVGGVKEKMDNTKRERTVDEILGSCHQLLQNLEHNYNQIENKIKELEKKPLKDNYRTALERIKSSFLAFGPALTTEIFKGALKSISQLTGRLLSRIVVDKLSQEVSHVATTEAAKEVTKRMTQETTSYFSYEAIKQFLTFSSKEVSKKWYQDVARTSAMASGAAAAIFLPFDAKDFYRDATHITKGAKSEIAEEIRNVARALEKLIDCLNEHL